MADLRREAGSPVLTEPVCVPGTSFLSLTLKMEEGAKPFPSSPWMALGSCLPLHPCQRPCWSQTVPAWPVAWIPHCPASRPCTELRATHQNLWSEHVGPQLKALSGSSSFWRKSESLSNALGLTVTGPCTPPRAPVHQACPYFRPLGFPSCYWGELKEGGDLSPAVPALDHSFSFS